MSDLTAILTLLVPYIRKCDWCGTRFMPLHGNQRFCTPSHSQRRRDAKRREAA